MRNELDHVARYAISLSRTIVLRWDAVSEYFKSSARESVKTRNKRGKKHIRVAPDIMRLTKIWLFNAIYLGKSDILVFE